MFLFWFCLFLVFFYSWAEPSAKRRGKKFSLKDKVWAAQWINEKLSLLMEDGLYVVLIPCLNVIINILEIIPYTRPT